MAEINPNLISALIKAGLIETAEDTTFEALTGGVSSDIWKIITPEREFCVKISDPLPYTSALFPVLRVAVRVIDIVRFWPRHATLSLCFL